ncbi:hypothetical protein [Fulvimarina sp. MAC3]|uniref:hypothetical protein n=1 Tax=Fulvimarina sp. MAC3 TaxID=3148887 RepID=UPI0031FDA7DB
MASPEGNEQGSSAPGLDVPRLITRINTRDWEGRAELEKQKLQREKSARGVSGWFFGDGHDPKHLVAGFLALLITLVLIIFAFIASEGLKDVFSTGLGVLGTISGYVLGANNKPSN